MLKIPIFYRKFIAFRQNRKIKVKGEPDSVESVCLEEYADISAAVDDAGGFQESCSLRINLRSRRLAELLIDEGGFLDRPALQRAIDAVSRHCYYYRPGGQHMPPGKNAC